MKTETPISTYKILLAEGFKPDKYKGYKLRDVYEAKEKAAKYTLQGISSPSVAFTIDGYIVKDTTVKKCDKLLLIRIDKHKRNNDKQQWLQLFVELKGTDIKSGLKQILSLVDHNRFKHISNIKQFARISSSASVPNLQDLDPTIRDLVQKLRKKRVHVKIDKNIIEEFSELKAISSSSKKR